MGRRIFNLLAALSLLFCLAAAGLWLRSLWVARDFGWTTPNGTWAIGWSRGELALYRDRLDVKRPMGFTRHNYPAFDLLGPSPGFAPTARCGGFALVSATAAHQYQLVFMPFWACLVLFAAIPALWLISFKPRQRKRRLRAGLCPNCGYDLRATPDPNGPQFDRCPECGTPTP